MVDNGLRLSMRITNNDFSITDALTGASTMFSYVGDTFIIKQLKDKDIASVIDTLIEAINSANEKVKWFTGKPDLSGGAYVQVISTGHYDWNITYCGLTAELKNGVLYRPRNFDTSLVCRLLFSVYQILMRDSVVLSPKTDIVRRIPDVGLLVWVHNGHSVVCYEKAVQGSCMVSCFIDGNYFRLVFVSPSYETNTVTLLTPNLSEIITFPLDKSVTFFYQCDEDAFTEKE